MAAAVARVAEASSVASAVRIASATATNLAASQGLVHSIESMTCVDGLGLRFMIFLQGCYRKCAFCSNPDTWSLTGKGADGKQIARKMMVREISDQLRRAQPYLRSNGGGVTVSGGEPLLQAPFVQSIFREAKSLGLTTCLDTSGYGHKSTYLSLLEDTDFVMLCHKSFNPRLHKDLTHVDIRHMWDFCDALDATKTPFRLRHVLIPSGYLRTNTKDELERIVDFVGSRDHCLGVEVLPYHKLGVHKWEALGMAYPLADMGRPTSEQVKLEVEALRGALPGKEVIV